jgi:hypothetical protein
VIATLKVAARCPLSGVHFRIARPITKPPQSHGGEQCGDERVTSAAIRPPLHLAYVEHQLAARTLVLQLPDRDLQQAPSECAKQLAPLPKSKKNHGPSAGQATLGDKWLWRGA